MSPLLLAALLAAAPEPAARLAILPTVVAGPHGEASAGQVFEACARGVGVRLDVSLVDYDTLFLQGAKSRVRRAAECGSDDACVAAVLAEVNAPAALRTIVNFAIDPPLVTVRLTTRDPASDTSAIRQTTAEDWARTVAEATDALLVQQGLRPAGRLIVETAPGAEIVVTPSARARPEGSGRYRLPPGRYTIEVAAAAGNARGEAVVTAHQATQVAVPILGPSAAAPAEDGGVVSKWWFWTALGALAVGAATTAVIVADPFGGDARPACLCITTPGGPCDPCP